MEQKKLATSGSYKPKWNHQPTEVLRVPEAFIDTFMGLAKLLDAGVINLAQIEAWAEKQMSDYKLLKQVQVQEDKQQQPEPEKRKRKAQKFTFE